LEFLTDDDINAAINEAYSEISDSTEWYERHSPMKTTAMRTYHDLRTILPDTFLTLKRIYNSVTARWLQPTSANELDNHYFVQWELTSGENEKCFLRGLWWLGQWPKRDNEISRSLLYYTAIPPAFENDGDVPGFPREFHQGLIEYAKATALAEVRETQKALDSFQKYQRYESSLKSYVNGRQGIAKETIL
jgi:hypothetical protein